MDIIKGESFSIDAVVYDKWTGETSTSTLANLTGATVKAYFKVLVSDSDAAALLTKTGTITDVLNGGASVQVLASDTINWTYAQVWYQVVAKLADGTFRFGQSTRLDVKPSVLKSLF